MKSSIFCAFQSTDPCLNHKDIELCRLNWHRNVDNGSGHCDNTAKSDQKEIHQ